VLVLEAVYLVAANAFLRSGGLAELINRKPEKTHISWESASTSLPGFFRIRGFELRAQTRKDQIYLHVAEASGRISLLELAFRTIHIRGVEARDADFRYRERLDRPPGADREDEPPKEPTNVGYWPEIPGFANPPDPKPEAIYPITRKKHPWTIAITGAEVEGPVRVAFNELRLAADGTVGGGVTVKPRRTITIHRGRLGLDSTEVTVGPDVVTDDLALNADLRFKPFPAKGAKAPDVLGGLSGELSIAGRLSERAAVSQEITPGLSTFGAGTVAAHLELKNGVVRDGSHYSLRSEAFHLRLMGLDASGSATVSGDTRKVNGEHRSTLEVVFGDFRFVDPEDGSTDISGSGLGLDAAWNGFSIADRVPAAHAVVVVPTATIHDIGAFDGLIPEQTALTLVSGTGTVESRIEIADRVAVGSLDLAAEEIALEAGGTPLRGDLEVHAKLAEGSLPTRHFDLTGTTIKLDKIVADGLSEKKQQRLDPWFCAIGLVQGDVTFGKPMAASGNVKLEMLDTRPVIGLLRRFGVGPGWLAMAPNIRNVDGTMDVQFDKGSFAFSDLVMAGDGFEGLGWMSVRDKKADGRLFVRFKAVMAGVAIDQGKAKIQLAKPRAWFDEQPEGPGSIPGDSR